MRGDVILPDEITIQSVKFDEDGTIQPDVVVVEETPEKPVEKKPKAKAVDPKEKAAPKKKEVAEKKPEPKKAPAKKKTELDKEVEKLSDLIEKTPAKEKPAAKKAPAKKTTKKEEPAKTEKAKPAAKKTTTKKVEPEKAKTTKKESEKKTLRPGKKDALDRFILFHQLDHGEGILLVHLVHHHWEPFGVPEHPAPVSEVRPEQVHKVPDIPSQNCFISSNELGQLIRIEDTFF